MVTKKPKYVYHGSSRRISGPFNPNVPNDLTKSKDNNINAIYATSSKIKAIAMGICASKGVARSGMDFEIGNRSKGIIYEGWPKQKYVYLYTFISDTFERSPKNSTQFVSRSSVSPVKIEKMEISKYIHLVRRASKKEIIDVAKLIGDKK